MPTTEGTDAPTDAIDNGQERKDAVVLWPFAVAHISRPGSCSLYVNRNLCANLA